MNFRLYEVHLPVLCRSEFVRIPCTYFIEVNSPLFAEVYPSDRLYSFIEFNLPFIA